jgi:hypothetical protein
MNKGLVVSAAGVIYLLAKPVQDIVVQPDGDSSLPRWRPEDRSALSSCRPC